MCMYFTRGVLCYNKKGEGAGKCCSVYTHCCQQQCCLCHIHMLCEAPWIQAKSTFLSQDPVAGLAEPLPPFPSPGIWPWGVAQWISSGYVKVQRHNLGKCQGSVSARLFCCSDHQEQLWVRHAVIFVHGDEAMPPYVPPQLPQ